MMEPSFRSFELDYKSDNLVQPRDRIFFLEIYNKCKVLSAYLFYKNIK